ncbi:negative regulator of differentiation 1 [Phycomyces blakesleeanus]
MTPVEQSHSLPGPIKHLEADTLKKARFGQPYSEIYGQYTPPASGQMIVNNTYSPMGGPGFQQPTALGPYSTGNLNFPNMTQYHAPAGTQTMNPPTPQFIHNSLGSPSTAAAAAAAAVAAAPFVNAYAHAQVQAHAHAHISTPPLQSTHQTARTVYVGNLPSETSVAEILDHVKSGVIDSIRPLPEKNCIFITFVDASVAAHFYHEATTKRLCLNGTELKVGWGKPSSIPSNIQLALQNGATRNVFLGSLDESITEEFLREDLARFGHIEHVKMIKDRNIAFVHFLSTSNAVKCVNTLPTETNWTTRRVNYGKDRCAPAKVAPLYPSNYPAFPVRFSPMTYDPYTGTVEAYPTHASLYPPTSLTGVANRTIYLGNIHPDTTCEEICNVIRGGILSQIRYMPDKHIAFVAFVDPALALHFYNQSVFHGIVIKNRRLKIGWGKASSLPSAVVAAIQNGGSRNVYLGNMDDSMTEEKLKQDFSDYGDIELVNTLKEKNCAFVNFTSIAAAVRAMEGIRSKEEYKKFRINYGKDRCGNPPRAHKNSVNDPHGPREIETELASRTSLTVDECQETVSGMLESVLVANG